MENYRLREGSNYEAWRLQKYTVANFRKLNIREQMRYLATCGHLAPSSHNTQPWKFHLDEDRKIIKVYLDLGKYFLEKGRATDLRRVLPISDRTGRQGCISVGCCIANIEIAARFFGFLKSVKIMDVPLKTVMPLKKISQKQDNLIHIADIVLGVAKPRGDRKVFEAIFTRTVNRSEYDQSKKIPSLTLNRIGKVNHPFVSIEILQRNAQTASKLMLVANSQLQADKTVFNDTGFLSELAKWVTKNGSSKGLGMPFETFGIQNNLDAVKLYLSFQLKKTFSIKDKAGFSQGAMKGIESAPLIGIVKVSKDNPAAWIEAGRCLGEIALIAEESGLAMAIHAGIAEVEGIKQSLTWIDHKKETVVIVFRLGYPRTKMPHAPRLPLEEVISESPII